MRSLSQVNIRTVVQVFVSSGECVGVMMASLWAKTGNLDDLLTAAHDCNK